MYHEKIRFHPHLGLPLRWPFRPAICRSFGDCVLVCGKFQGHAVNGVAFFVACPWPSLAFRWPLLGLCLACPWPLLGLCLAFRWPFVGPWWPVLGLRGLCAMLCAMSCAMSCAVSGGRIVGRVRPALNARSEPMAENPLKRLIPTKLLKRLIQDNRLKRGIRLKGEIPLRDESP